MDGYHTDMIARTGAPDMTSFFFLLPLSTPSSPFFLARNRPGFCRCKALLVLHHLSYRKFAIYLWASHLDRDLLVEEKKRKNTKDG